MHKTYELYFHDDEQAPPAFEALTCATDAELVTALRRRLAERQSKSVVVHEFGRELFTLNA